tara:strand:- start:4882 stop:5082 length:201 start_codon:yes stop_codon:yes gene_type:complete
MTDNFKYVLKVIMSCKNEAQLESASDWIDKVKLSGTWLDQYSDYIDLVKAVQEQRLYINKRAEVGL